MPNQKEEVLEERKLSKIADKVKSKRSGLIKMEDVPGGEMEGIRSD